MLREKNWDEYRQKPIGNGPYRMAEPWKHDKYVKLAKSTECAGPGKGDADEITFRIYADPSAACGDAVAGTWTSRTCHRPGWPARRTSSGADT